MKKWVDGRTYHGQLKCDEMHGHGCMKWANACQYEGEWLSSKRHGHGVLTTCCLDPCTDVALRTSYNGKWQDDLQHGHGESADFCEDGARRNTCTGTWYAGERQGVGSSSFADGSSYKGEYVAGVPHGQGCYRYMDGSEYSGGWCKGEQHGACNIMFSNGTCYDCEYCQLLHAHKTSPFTKYQQMLYNAPQSVFADTEMEDEEEDGGFKEQEVAGANAK